MKTPKQHHVDYYDRNMEKRRISIEPVGKADIASERKSFDWLSASLYVVVFIFGMVCGASLQRECTVTITDMQGVRHQIHGECDK